MTWFLLGVITGIIIGVLIDRDTVYKTIQKIGKLKVKNSSDVSVEMTKREQKRKNRQTRKQNRRDRRTLN